VEAAGSSPGARRLGSALVVGAAVLLILRAVPLIEAYALKLLSLHSSYVVAGVAAAAALAFGALWLLIAKRPRAAAVLVLAAGTAKEGPGPLVSAFVGRAGANPIPITIVPGGLSDSEIDALA